MSIPIANNISSTSDEVRKCGICWDTFEKKHKIAYPEQCENHSFCFECLKSWARRNRSCPLDRKPFEEIYVYNWYENSYATVFSMEPINFWNYLEAFRNDYVKFQVMNKRTPSYLKAIRVFQKVIREWFEDEKFIITLIDHNGNLIEEEQIYEYLKILERNMSNFVPEAT